LQSEQFPASLDDLPVSERLPVGWNNDQQTYILRYVQPSSKRTILLKLVRSDADLLVNALLRPEERVAACTLTTTDFVSDGHSSFDTLFANAGAESRLLVELRREVFDKLFNESSGSSSNPSRSNPNRQPNNERHTAPPLRRDPPSANPLMEPYPMPMNRPFPELGGADLDPLGRGFGGGMLMDPRQFEQMRVPRPGYGPMYPRFDPSSGLDHSLPPGAVPPGARFDYIGPPRSRRPPTNFGPRAPHPDLERPPDYDDMFM
jgi:proteasome inhibitor subunit 1 (PI31)